MNDSVSTCCPIFFVVWSWSWVAELIQLVYQQLFERLNVLIVFRCWIYTSFLHFLEMMQNAIEIKLLGFCIFKMMILFLKEIKLNNIDDFLWSLFESCFAFVVCSQMKKSVDCNHQWLVIILFHQYGANFTGGMANKPRHVWWSKVLEFNICNFILLNWIYNFFLKKSNIRK